MTTTEATIHLAHSVIGGGYDKHDDHITSALAAGRAWKWRRAEHHLHAAYRALGVEPPTEVTGEAWHAGETEIQRRASAWMDGDRQALSPDWRVRS